MHYLAARALARATRARAASRALLSAPTVEGPDRHPDGDPVLVGGDVTARPKGDKVVLISSFFDEVRRGLSDASR